jgi:hypothetical protein
MDDEPGAAGGMECGTGDCHVHDGDVPIHGHQFTDGDEILPTPPNPVRRKRYDDFMCLWTVDEHGQTHWRFASGSARCSVGLRIDGCELLN